MDTFIRENLEFKVADNSFQLSFHHLHFDGSILPYFSLSYSYGIMTGDLFHNVIVASLEKVLVLIRQSLAVRKVPETFTSHLKKNYNYKFSTVVL